MGPTSPSTGSRWIGIRSSSMRLGILDVGTNSIHLAIVEAGSAKRFRIRLHRRTLIRLGDEGLARGRLTAAAMRRAMAVLRRYAAALARSRVDHVEAVATSAVREAANGRAFVHHVRTRLGLPLRIIGGREETRLISRGVLYTYPSRRTTLLVTIGGGSAQVILGDAKRLRYAASVKLGAARLAQRFFRRHPPLPGELKALRRHLRRTWAPVCRALRRRQWKRVLACSAMIDQLIVASYLARHRQPPHDPRRRSLSRRALRRLISRLRDAPAAQRKRLPGLDPRRADLALPAAEALLSWMEGCGIHLLRGASGSLREGLVVEWLERGRRGSRVPAGLQALS